MHRNHLLQQLSRYIPSDEHDKQALEDTTYFVKNTANCFERVCKIGHITASAWLINSNHHQAMLLHHKKLNKWLQLGGHTDGESNILTAALREAREESGIFDIVPISTEIFDVDVHAIPAYGDTAEHYHYDIRYLFKVTNPKAQPVSNHESNSVQWMSAMEINHLELDDSVKRLVKKWLAYLKEENYAIV